jgi:hypothetical protein
MRRPTVKPSTRTIDKQGNPMKLRTAVSAILLALTSFAVPAQAAAPGSAPPSARQDSRGHAAGQAAKNTPRPAHRKGHGAKGLPQAAGKARTEGHIAPSGTQRPHKNPKGNTRRHAKHSTHKAVPAAGLHARANTPR